MWALKKKGWLLTRCFICFPPGKPKCPIFKALVAGFRGFSLPTKIGHLVFQAMLFSLLPLYCFFQTQGPGNTWFSSTIPLPGSLWNDSPRSEPICDLKTPGSLWLGWLVFVCDSKWNAVLTLRKTKELHLKIGRNNKKRERRKSPNHPFSGASC